LVNLLDEYPLRGRKSVDYAIWRSAVQWWVSADPKGGMRNRDWQPMAYLAQRLKDVKRFGEAFPPDYSCDPPGLCRDWTGYLGGYLTAEGHFGITANGERRLRPRMQVNTRADDAPLLAELAHRTGVGRLYRYPRKSYEVSPVASWNVRSAADLRALVEILDRCPPRGRKEREYEIWREAVFLLEAGRRPDQIRLRQCADALKQARVYRPTG
jgi:hypothetical protein